MNRYGARAMSRWRIVDPSGFDRILNPEEFFSTLGEEAEQLIQERETMLAGPDPAGEGYLEKVSRRNHARMEAERQVLDELLPAPDPPPDEPDPDHPLSLVTEVHAAIDAAAMEPEVD